MPDNSSTMLLADYRELTDDEMIHIPLQVLVKLDGRVPHDMPIINGDNTSLLKPLYYSSASSSVST